MKIQSDPGMLMIGDVALDSVIRVAFGLREYQYEGPAWLHTTRYDIVARTGSAQTAGGAVGDAAGVADGSIQACGAPRIEDDAGV